uniref:GDYXXLXY domain-containing protein n=1 Tax=Solibacter usitatus (strain Ellin6076) TaxID=234267 RepID=Q024N4_SOLUE
MRPLQRGIALGVLQCLLVLSVAGKYAWDRERLPRAWVRTGPSDPYLPIRGRYIALRLEVASMPQATAYDHVELYAENGVLKARPSAGNGGLMVTGGPHPMLAESVAYFIPASTADPTSLRPGEELWAEVSVPRSGPPRPVRLAVKRNGVLAPLEVR